MIRIKPLDYVRLVANSVLLEAATDLITVWVLVGILFLAGAVLGLIGLDATHSIAVWFKAGSLALGAAYSVAVAVVSTVRLVYCIKYDLRAWSIREKRDADGSVGQDNNAGTSSST